MAESRYNNPVVRTMFKEAGIPAPVFEHRFHPTRKWRFDLAWPDRMVALEVQGGMLQRGRHTRGMALLKEYEKLNAACVLGWRVLFCQPDDIIGHTILDAINLALNC